MTKKFHAPPIDSIACRHKLRYTPINETRKVSRTLEDFASPNNKSVSMANRCQKCHKNFALFIIETGLCCTLVLFFKARSFTAKIFQDPAFFSKKNTRPCLFLHDPLLPINNERSLIKPKLLIPKLI